MGTSTLALLWQHRHPLFLTEPVGNLSDGIVTFLGAVIIFSGCPCHGIEDDVSMNVIPVNTDTDDSLVSRKI